MKSFCHNMRTVGKGGGGMEKCVMMESAPNIRESMLGEEEKRGFGALLINEKRRKGGEGHLFPHLSAGFNNIKIPNNKTFWETHI